MNELQKKQLEFLNDTISYFNSKNRCSIGDGYTSKCLYYHPNFEGCAIGRKIADKELCKKLDNYHLIDEGNGVLNVYIFNQLPNELKELGKEFLLGVQQLHDVKDFWNETGLSDDGNERVIDIKEKFGLL